MKETAVQTGISATNDNKKLRHKGRKFFSAFITVIAVMLIIGAAGTIFVNSYFIPVWVDGTSMEPNLKNYEFGLMDGHARAIAKVKRFDIVIAYADLNRNGINDDDPVIKRVIGLPGETLQIFDGGEDNPDYIEITDNGTTYQLDETFYNPHVDMTYRSGSYFATSTPLTLGADEYFLLGDNRGVSVDSRYFGPVNRDLFAGVLFCIYGQADSIQTLVNSDGTISTVFSGRHYYLPWEIRFYE